MTEHLIHLFKYNDWATQRALNFISGSGIMDDKLTELSSHIVAAQLIWLNRVTGQEIFIDPWEKYTVDLCRNKSTGVTTEWINYLEGLSEDDLLKRIKYKNSRGEEFENNIKDIVTHVINHSTYHRAQIAQYIKLKGGKPVATDYILYQRTLS